MSNSMVDLNNRTEQERILLSLGMLYAAAQAGGGPDIVWVKKYTDQIINRILSPISYNESQGFPEKSQVEEFNLSS